MGEFYLTLRPGACSVRKLHLCGLLRPKAQFAFGVLGLTNLRSRLRPVARKQKGPGVPYQIAGSVSS